MPQTCRAGLRYQQGGAESGFFELCGPSHHKSRSPSVVGLRYLLSALGTAPLQLLGDMVTAFTPTKTRGWRTRTIPLCGITASYAWPVLAS